MINYYYWYIKTLGNTSTTERCTDMFEYYVKLFFLSQKDYKLAHMLSKYINLICKAVMWPGMGRSGQIRSHICLGLTGLVGALPRDISSIHPLTGYQ